MLVYVLRRLLLTIPLLIAVSLVVFAVVSSFPGDPCREQLGQHPTPEALEACRSSLNLDGPFHERYLRYLEGAVQLEFGHNIRTEEPVGEEILLKLPPTIELSFIALLLAFLVGNWIGTRSALKPGTWIDAVGQVLSLGGISIPVFWLGMMLISLFGVKLGWLPFSGWTASEVGPDFDFKTDFLLFEPLFRLRFDVFWNALGHIALPAIALSTIPLATITRMTRSSVLEEVNKDYVTTARAKGLSERKVITKHVRRNALIPVVTITGLQLGTLLSGAVLTETVFSWPGLGTYLVRGADETNYPVVMGCMLLFVTTFVLVNLFVDVLYHMIDPRIRDEGL
ncbi:MAG: ABC transporter permease [Planctomycetota bacterium]|nr:ABC transporter permease [Planctomycetota bacterium]